MILKILDLNGITLAVNGSKFLGIGIDDLQMLAVFSFEINVSLNDLN